MVFCVIADISGNTYERMINPVGIRERQAVGDNQELNKTSPSPTAAA
jgi:hypothetical protein